MYIVYHLTDGHQKSKALDGRVCKVFPHQSFIVFIFSRITWHYIQCIKSLPTLMLIVNPSLYILIINGPTIYTNVVYFNMFKENSRSLQLFFQDENWSPYAEYTKVLELYQMVLSIVIPALSKDIHSPLEKNTDIMKQKLIVAME